MNYYGIFDENNNYKLLRYSNSPQENMSYNFFDIYTKTTREIKEICLPNIEYSVDNIGKHYNIQTNSFE